jgi:SsrA-binding protein
MTKKKAEPENFKVIAENRKARHEYFIEDTVEAGIVLMGTEVKSLRLGKASLGEAWAGPSGYDIYLMNCHIGEYPPAAQFNHTPKRPRKLLLHRREAEKLIGRVSRDGYTLVPLSLYFNARGMIKCRIGLAKGKKKTDKRETIKQRDWQRQKQRLMKG